MTGVATAGHTHTIAQIAPSGITCANIADGTVATADIQDSAVTDAKIGPGLNAAKITAGILPNNVLDSNLRSLAAGFISGRRVVPRFGAQQAYFGDAIYSHDQDNETIGYALGSFNGHTGNRGFHLFEYESNRFKKGLLSCLWDSDTLQCHVNLKVAGTVAAISCCQPSDRRWKREVLPLANVLDKVRSMNAVTYEWSQYAAATNDLPRERQIGFIAQELEPLVPEAVKTDAAGYKYIDYGRLVPVLAEALKEQQAQIDSLRQEIRDLRAER